MAGNFGKNNNIWWIRHFPKIGGFHLADQGTTISAWAESGIAAMAYYTRSAKSPLAECLTDLNVADQPFIHQIAKLNFPTNISGHTVCCTRINHKLSNSWTKVQSCENL